MHLIIGKGNLGVDLMLELKRQGHKAVILTRSDGFKWPESYNHMMDLKPTHIWVTAGHGSVFECAANFTQALATHTAMPMEIARNAPEHVKVVLFSTDYVADEVDPSSEDSYQYPPKSWYAMTKRWMEQGIEWSERKNVAVVRVSSLYGMHFPERCFPGKLLKRYMEPTSLTLPENQVCPTPTDWIAFRLVNEMDGLFSNAPMRYHLAPMGSTTTLEWGRMILGPRFDISSAGIEQTRPARSGLGCSFGIVSNWYDLWASRSGWFRASP